MFNKVSVMRMLASMGLMAQPTMPMAAELPRVSPRKYNGNPSKQHGHAHFKQNRRKQLKDTAKRKAKKRGQA